MTNNTRALIQEQLAQGVGDPKTLAAALGLTPAAVRHHLRALREGAPAPGGRRPEGQTREAVLEALASRPFVTPAQLSKELGLDPRANAAGRLLKELVAEGLAECAARGVYVRSAPSSTSPA